MPIEAATLDVAPPSHQVAMLDVGTVVTDADGCIVAASVSPAQLERLGVPAGPLVGRRAPGLLLSEPAWRLAQVSMSSGSRAGGLGASESREWVVPFESIVPGRTDLFMTWQVSPTELGTAAAGYLLIGRRRTLDALPEPPGGTKILHDINEQLGIAVGYLDLLLETGEIQPAESEFAREALTATLSAADKVRLVQAAMRNARQARPASEPPGAG